jgi:NhaC family Na+:H+ antiporter
MSEDAGGRSHTPVTLFEAVLPLLTMFGLFLAGALFLELGTDLIVVAMLGAATVAGVIAVRHGWKWSDIERSTGQKFAAVVPAILILLAIGLLIGTWVYSGTIPFMVYWGVRLVSPEHLVLTAFLATAVMSLATGTSWGSAGTIGVALMGTAAALDVPLAMAGGAVISGAYFGDKMSPLSDMTNIAAISADANLYRHIRHMIYTAGPSFVLAVLVYSFVGGGAPGGGIPEQGRILLADLDAAFSLNPLVLLPAVMIVLSMIWQMPPALAIAASSVVAAIIGITLQGFGLQNAIVAGVSGFDPAVVADAAPVGGFGEAFGTLVGRGGIASMVPTLLVIFAAFLLAGALDVSGSLDLLINRMLGAVRGTFGLIAATMASGATMIGLTSHGAVTCLIVGGLYQKAYRERGFAPENLSRSLEDSVTIVEPLMPWTVSAVYMATTIGVPTLSYAPWAVFCYMGPVWSLLYAAFYDRTGVGLKRTQAQAQGASVGAAGEDSRV